jgi:hypothetical protein
MASAMTKVHTRSGAVSHFTSSYNKLCSCTNAGVVVVKFEIHSTLLNIISGNNNKKHNNQLLVVASRRISSTVIDTRRKAIIGCKSNDRRQPADDLERLLMLKT